MICPNEHKEMHRVLAESHYGQQVILDQCPYCGGIWFDKFELYMPKSGQAEKIELMDKDILRSHSAIENSELLCPRDGARLVRFTDPYFPKEIIIARCPLCEGFWLNRGVFTKYQNFRQEKHARREKFLADKKLGQDIDHILLENKNGGSADVLNKLGRFLSIPLDSTSWRPVEPERLSDAEQNALNLVLNAVRVVLGAFIRI